MQRGVNDSRRRRPRRPSMRSASPGDATLSNDGGRGVASDGASQDDAATKGPLFGFVGAQATSRVYDVSDTTGAWSLKRKSNVGGHPCPFLAFDPCASTRRRHRRERRARALLRLQSSDRRPLGGERAVRGRRGHDARLVRRNLGHGCKLHGRQHVVNAIDAAGVLGPPPTPRPPVRSRIRLTQPFGHSRLRAGARYRRRVAIHPRRQHRHADIKRRGPRAQGRGPAAPRLSSVGEVGLLDRTSLPSA